MHQPYLFTTAREARSNFEAEYARNGIARCPTCDKLYAQTSRKITRADATFLASLYALGPGWHHYKTVKRSSRNYNVLQLFGLAVSARDATDEEKQQLRDRGGKVPGYWKISELGKAFVSGDASLPSKALYDPKSKMVLNYSTDSILFTDILEDFDFETLLAESAAARHAFRAEL